jgi:hypothetical protein
MDAASLWEAMRGVGVAALVISFVPGSCSASTPHQSLPPPDQRQGRALHPVGLARVGLRADLRELRSAQARLAGLDPLLQLASPAPWHQSDATGASAFDSSKEPVDISQLARAARTGAFLHRWTLHGAVRTEHAAVVRQGAQHRPALLALVEPLARIGRHGLRPHVPALGTRDHRLQNNGGHLTEPASTWRGTPRWPWPS